MAAQTNEMAAAPLADLQVEDDGSMVDFNNPMYPNTKRLADGRLVGRWEKRCDECNRHHRTTPVEAVALVRPPKPARVVLKGQAEGPQLDPTRDLYEDVPVWLVPPRCTNCRWRLATQHLRRNPILNQPTHRDMIVGEANRLDLVGIAPYPEMAATLRGLAEQYPVTPADHAFPVGVSFVTPNALARIGLDQVKDLIARHRDGDFGDYGRASDALATDAARWAPSAFSIATQNVAARDSGEGFVQSRFPLTDPGKLPVSIGVITVYRPGSTAETIVFRSSRDTLSLSL